jgi:hypothetical protein
MTVREERQNRPKLVSRELFVMMPRTTDCHGGEHTSVLARRIRSNALLR